MDLWVGLGEDHLTMKLSENDDDNGTQTTLHVTLLAQKRLTLDTLDRERAGALCLNSIFYTLHFTLCTLCTLYFVHFALCTFYTLHFGLYTLYILYFELCTFNSSSELYCTLHLVSNCCKATLTQL